jgi:hypothetical protein
MASAKPNQKIDIDKLQVTLGELEKLEPKPKSSLTMRESIYFLREQLKSALKKGYSYQDLSELLEQQQIVISAATLKQYLTESNKEAAKGKRGGKSGGAKSGVSKVASERGEQLTGKTLAPDINELKPEQQQQPEDLEAEQEVIAQLAVSPTPADVEKNLTTQSESSVSLSENSESEESAQRDTDTKTSQSVRGNKLKKAGRANRDLASEFNQY